MGSSGFVSGWTCVRPCHSAADDFEGSNCAGSARPFGLKGARPMDEAISVGTIVIIDGLGQESATESARTRDEDVQSKLSLWKRASPTTPIHVRRRTHTTAADVSKRVEVVFDEFDGRVPVTVRASRR